MAPFVPKVQMGCTDMHSHAVFRPYGMAKCTSLAAQRGWERSLSLESTQGHVSRSERQRVAVQWHMTAGIVTAGCRVSLSSQRLEGRTKSLEWKIIPSLGCLSCPPKNINTAVADVSTGTASQRTRIAAPTASGAKARAGSESSMARWTIMHVSWTRLQAGWGATRRDEALLLQSCYSTPSSHVCMALDSNRQVLHPEVLQDHPSTENHHARETDRREGQGRSVQSADVAKSRWLVDREANEWDEPTERVRGTSHWSKDLAESASSGVARLKASLRQWRGDTRQLGRNGVSRTQSAEWDSRLGRQDRKPLQPAERKSKSNSGRAGGAPGSPTAKAASQRISNAVVLFALCGGCAAAALIGHRAHTRTPAPLVSTKAGRQVLGHVAVEEAPLSDLAPVLADGSVQLRSAAAESFLQMQASARSQGVYLLPLSGFRSVRDQEDVFYGIKAERNQNLQERAKVSAPPGFSEHHTGYALDIGDATEPATHLEFDFENTDAFQWLQDNANRFHFELSFPPANEQGIMYEPWHWRFVGNNHATITFYGNAKDQSLRPRAR